MANAKDELNKNIGRQVKRINAQLSRISELVGPYKEIENPNWGHVGNLGHVLTTLRGLADFLEGKGG